MDKSFLNRAKKRFGRRLIPPVFLCLKIYNLVGSARNFSDPAATFIATQIMVARQFNWRDNANRAN